MTQEGFSAPGAFWAHTGSPAAHIPRPIRPASVARALYRCGKSVLRGIARSILGQAHVLGELLVSADIHSEEVGELRNRAAADVVVECRDLIAQLGIAQRLVYELVPARDDGV